MKASVYKKAAQNIATGRNDVCCGAVASAATELEMNMFKRNVYVSQFHRIFKPGNVFTFEPYFGTERNKDQQRHRETALLFLAEMLETDSL